MPDAAVASAIEHWAPRCIQNGVDYNDFAATTARVQTWAQWLPEWSKTADHAAARAVEAERAGRRRSAGEAWLRAAVTRHFGKFVWVLDPEVHAEATHASVREMLAAHRLLETGLQRIEAPLDSAKVVANLRRPAGADRPPLVILIPGLDSTKEEFFHLEESFLRRGLATLSLDGAGQGEVGLLLPIRHDYEACVAAILGALAERPNAGVDLGQIGAFGVSLGGYYAARVAAYDPRVRALASLSGPYNFGEIWAKLPGLTRATFTLKSGAADEEEGRERALALDLAGVCERIAVPALFVTGRRDAVVPWQQTEQIARQTPTSKFVLHEDGNHGCSNLTALARPAIADWMAEQLAASA
ncbi:MAG TPA: alpha/beta hydrolase [Solirubrobacteraceae bacterium]|jgi:2,6-dihydroxypseudooxynicotine hydrolase|nr:alpha/beta hydrolase [Solirubrobacteraceae bacterium]